MKIGLIGYGFMGGAHAAAIQQIPGVTLAAVASRTRPSEDGPVRGNLDLKAGPLPESVKWTPDWQEIVDDPEIDAIDICLPTHLHKQVIERAFANGKHVLCEKPMAMNEAEARAMLRAADQAADQAKDERGKIFGVAYYRRCYPKLQRAKQLLVAGAIGKPVLAELTSHAWFDGQGSRSWLVDPAQAGGGPLFDVASHRIDVLNFLFGQPQRVAAQLSNVVHRYPVEDNATVMIEYADGARGIVDVRWHSKISRDECRIRGTDGEMELSPLNGPDLIYPGARENLPPHANLHYPMLENFVDAVEGKSPLLSSGASSFWTDWVTEQARRGS
jgi:1,5-anhydro-D-fructose reductase (1,5-anhydro-D-mannitol-forming)